MQLFLFVLSFFFVVGGVSDMLYRWKMERRKREVGVSITPDFCDSDKKI